MENCDAILRAVWDRSENSIIAVQMWFTLHRETVPTHHRRAHPCSAVHQINYAKLYKQCET